MHSRRCHNLLDPSLVVADVRIWQVRGLLLDRYVNIGGQVLVHLLDDVLKIIIPVIFFDWLEHLGYEEKIRNELGRGQKEWVLSHVVADGTHQLLIEANEAGVAFKLLDVAVVVGRSTGVRLAFEYITAVAAPFTIVVVDVGFVILFLVFLLGVLDGFDLLKHLEHVVILVPLLGSDVVLRGDKELEYFPDLCLLMPTHL